MAKKNHDARSFNRTGIFDRENMTIQYEDKNGVYLFDLGGALDKLDGLEISINASTEVPAEPLDEG